MSDQDDTAPHPPVTPRSSLGSAGLSFSSGSSISPSTSSSSSQGSAKSAVSECLGAWLNYLQVLNNLCASGYRLSQTISALEQWGNQSDNSQTSQLSTSQPGPSSMQFQGAPSTSQTTIHFANAWDDLARATTVATGTVKSYIVSVLQDFVTTNTAPDQETDLQKTKEHNQQIIMENTQTMINLHHQFCVASYDSFSSLMCCFVCQAPVGLPHEPDCSMINQKTSASTGDPRSQTPSPNFGTVATQKPEPFKTHGSEIRGALFGSGSTQASSEHGYPISGIGIEQTRGPSPHQEIRGPSPIHGFLESVRGPLPNPGHLLTMKAPFQRGSRSPLNFPLFPLAGQRRWSEAAAGEVRCGDSTMDMESQMRRWSMPWEASKSDKNTVAWHQTKIMPISKLAVPISKAGSDRSQSTTPDSLWQPSVTSSDGLAEAIQLLSFRPMRIFPPQAQQPVPGQQLIASQQTFAGQQPFTGQHPFTGQQQFVGQQQFAGPQPFVGQQQQYTGQQQFIVQQPLVSQQQVQQQQPFASQQSFPGQQQPFPGQQHPPMGPPFIEEPAAYEMWSTGSEDRLPCIKFPPRDNERDENPS